MLHKEHHTAWLSKRPHRSVAWLKQMLANGFDVHHLDGNHANNDPNNLLLVELADHMDLHGLKIRVRRLVGELRHRGSHKLYKTPVGPVSPAIEAAKKAAMQVEHEARVKEWALRKKQRHAAFLYRNPRCKSVDLSDKYQYAA